MSSISILPIFYLISTIHVVTEICISIVIDSEAYLRQSIQIIKKILQCTISCIAEHLIQPAHFFLLQMVKQIVEANCEKSIRTVKENINEVRQTVKSITFMTSQYQREFDCEKTRLSLSRIKYRLLHLQWRSHERAYIDQIANTRRFILQLGFYE